ncbi:MAG TPA: class I SAM-dependent methyltransferase [Acidobacteriota bacterium]|nr:class I SAM-dependent methyltransferase [Acidobacteriota bacterium]
MILETLRFAKRQTVLATHLLRMSPRGFMSWLFSTGNERYARFQRIFYDFQAGRSSYGDRLCDHVVGSYEDHDHWRDYDEYLMRYVGPEFRRRTALDFGCGPGRNLIKYHDRFARLDGVDISSTNIENARINVQRHGIALPTLYVNNGYDLGGIPSERYDFVMSTICMQHICVHSTRLNLLREFHRVLQDGGRLSIQMGYGADSPNTVPYDTDFTTALTTNRGCDVEVRSPDQIERELTAVGFSEFKYWIRPTGPGDTHPNWIFFTAVKWGQI